MWQRTRSRYSYTAVSYARGRQISTNSSSPTKTSDIPRGLPYSTLTSYRHPRDNHTKSKIDRCHNRRKIFTTAADWLYAWDRLQLFDTKLSHKILHNSLRFWYIRLLPLNLNNNNLKNIYLVTIILECDSFLQI